MLMGGTGRDDLKQLLVGWLVLTGVVTVVTGFGFWGVLAGMTGLVLTYWGVSTAVKSNASRSIEESSVGALDGERATVQVVGRVRSIDDSLSVPLSGTDCVAYDVVVEEHEPSDGGGD